MPSRLFPRQIDNTYHGLTMALWLLAPILLVKLVMGFNVSGLNPFLGSRFVMQAADGIPISSYPPDAAATATLLFASWGLALLLMSLFGILALIRYRGMTPLIYLLLTLEQAGRKALSILHPIVRDTAPAGISPGTAINWALTGLLVLGLILSLIEKRTAKS